MKNVFVNYYAPGDTANLNLGQLLSACSGVDRMVLYSCISYDALADLRPRRLAVCLSLVQIKNLSYNGAFTLPFFSRLTHLELFDSASWHGDLPLNMLPCLTHLALMGSILTDMPLVFNTLQICRKLEMLLFVDGFYGCPEEMVAFVSDLTDDPRIFLYDRMQTMGEDWENCISEEDIWMKARKYGRSANASQQRVESG